MNSIMSLKNLETRRYLFLLRKKNNVNDFKSIVVMLISKENLNYIKTDPVDGCPTPPEQLINHF